MSTNICFDLICDECVIFSEVAKAPSEFKDCNLTGFAIGNRWKGFRDAFSKIYKLDEGVAKEGVKAELARLQDDYNFESISKHVLSDRFLVDLPDEEVDKVIVSTFLAVENMIRDGVNVFITTGVAYFYNLAILTVSRKYNVECFSLYGARLSESRFTFSRGIGGRWDSVARVYDELVASESPAEERYLNYVKKQRERPETPDYMKSAYQQGGIGSVFINEFLRRMKYWYFEKWGVDGDYLTQHPVWYLKRDLKRFFKKIIYKKLVSFSRFFENEEYFLYPIHLQPEASTLVLGKSYFDQLNTIRQIARSLPLGCKLYVKEHPAAFGRHSRDFYRAVKKIYGVRLIAPWESSQELIRKSRGVIVISGTMGWEAFLLGRPALVLGDVFYDGFRGVYKVKDLEQLQSMLCLKSLRPATIQQAALAVESLYKGSFPGFFFPYKLDMREKVASAENVACFQRGIRRIIDENIH